MFLLANKFCFCFPRKNLQSSALRVLQFAEERAQESRDKRQQALEDFEHAGICHSFLATYLHIKKYGVLEFHVALFDVSCLAFPHFLF